MQSQFRKQWYKKISLPFSVKCGAIFLLFLLSVLVVACSSGANTTASTDLGNPPVTVTINLGGNSSPTPPLAPYWCGAWATNTTPSYTAGTVGVYAKFTQNVNMNPVGVGGATATATVTWPDQTTSTQTVTTTNDGLAVFTISVNGRADAVGKFTYISVSFHKNGIDDCTVPQGRVAFFTLVVVSPTTTGVASPSTTPTCTPTPHHGPKKTPTPKPGGC